MLAGFADDPDMENGMIDSTVVRAYPCAAGVQKNDIILGFIAPEARQYTGFAVA